MKASEGSGVTEQSAATQSATDEQDTGRKQETAQAPVKNPAAAKASSAKTSTPKAASIKAAAPESAPAKPAKAALASVAKPKLEKPVPDRQSPEAVLGNEAPAVQIIETQSIEITMVAETVAAETVVEKPAVEPERRAAEPERRPNLNDRNPPRIPSKAENFVAGDHVVYPTHGVGKVERIAVEEIAGHSLELIHITFEENRMTLRVPVAKARSAGLRKLASRKLFDEALAVLKGRARIKRTMWSRRAQEYEAKINSGDPLAIAEVVRDLHRNAGQPDQSFSERQIYEAAMDRLAAELGALDKTDKATAATKLANFLKTVA